jgi:hypothetical protein
MIDKLGYNPLGLLGPVYPRPEYRPPVNREETTEGSSDSTKNKTSTKEEKTKTQAEEAKTAKSQEGRLNLASAIELTKKVSEDIVNLSPTSSNSGPHQYNPYFGLYSARYV